MSGGDYRGVDGMGKGNPLCGRRERIAQAKEQQAALEKENASIKTSMMRLCVLRMSSGRRTGRCMHDLSRLLQRLVTGGVEFVLVGGYAAVAHGGVDHDARFRRLHSVVAGESVAPSRGSG